MPPLNCGLCPLHFPTRALAPVHLSALPNVFTPLPITLILSGLCSLLIPAWKFSTPVTEWEWCAELT